MSIEDLLRQREIWRALRNAATGHLTRHYAPKRPAVSPT